MTEQLTNAELRKQPHDFKGTISVCMICYRPKQDPIHNGGKQDLAIQHSVPATGKYTPDEPLQLAKHEHTCTICNKVLVCETDQQILHCKIKHDTYVCGKCFHLSDQDKEYASWAARGTVTSHCPQHECPKCGDTWGHSYACGKDTTHKALCIKCASQATANIFRPVEIEQIAQLSSEILTGSEIAEINANNEALCWSLTHDSVTGKLLPDWQEKLHKHIFNQQQLVERHKRGGLNSSKCRNAYQQEEMTSLTPEELEHYERQAKKRKSSKQDSGVQAGKSSSNSNSNSKPDKEAKEASNSAYNKLIKGLTDKIRKKRPNLSEDELLIAAKKRMAIIDAEEGSNN